MPLLLLYIVEGKFITCQTIGDVLIDTLTQEGCSTAKCARI